MMLIVGLPLIVCIVGLLMYVLATNPKVQNIGLAMFCVGLFFAMAGVGQANVSFR